MRHLEAVPFCVNYFHIVSVTYIIAVPICTWLSSWYYCMYIENWTIQLGWYTENRTIQLGGCLNNCTVYELTVSVDTYIKNWTIQLGWCLNILHNYEPTVPNIENRLRNNHSAWLLFQYIAQFMSELCQQIHTFENWTIQLGYCLNISQFYRSTMSVNPYVENRFQLGCLNILQFIN